MKRLNIDSHYSKYESILNRIVKNSRLKNNSKYIENIEYKVKQYEVLLDSLNNIKNQGSKLNDYINNIFNIYVELKELLEQMDDKFLLFVVGTGNYGKSTLINALLKDKIAPVDFRPKTWKIDVYYLDEENTQKVIVKLKDGSQLTFGKEEAIDYIENEEKSMYDSLKEYNKVKNVELKKCSTKEEREEMIEKLTKEYIYKSKVVEVRWPVENNYMLKHMLLVDTPGLTQDIYDIKNSIKDYYFKADGVLWLLDAQTISASNSNELILELENYLDDIGGINNNIIGVVNKVDKVIKSGGQDALNNVMKDANKFFGDRFKYIVPISSKEAFENSNDINLKKLNNTIEDVFLSDSNTMKSSSKKIAVEKIVKTSIDMNNNFIKDARVMNKSYKERRKHIDNFIKDLKNDIDKELDKLVEGCLNRAYSNIEIHTKNLFDIRGADKSREYVINKIFNLNGLEESLNSFVNSKLALMDIESDKLYKYCTLSQYKYISHIVEGNNLQVLNIQKLNLEVKGNFNLYTSLGNFVGGSILDTIGSVVNELYKGIVKLFKMGSVKTNLRSTIYEITEKSKKNVSQNLGTRISSINSNAMLILNKSYENVLFSYNEFDKVNTCLNKFNEDIKLEEDLNLKDLF